MDNHVIVGVHITDRSKHVGEVQKVLTECGRGIKTRLGLHETNENACSPNGLLLLEMLDDDTVDKCVEKLNGIEGVETQKMVFGH